MTWRGQPSIKAGVIGGRKAKSAGSGEGTRANHYANPPSNLGLNGLQLNSDPYARRGYTRPGVVGTSSTFARKGEPFV